MGELKGTQGGPPSGKGYGGLAVALSGSMAPTARQVLDQGSGIWGEQREEEGVDQADHEQQLEPVLPEPKAGTSHMAMSTRLSSPGSPYVYINAIRRFK